MTEPDEADALEERAVLVSTYRAGSSRAAIRMTHTPTGLTV